LLLLTNNGTYTPGNLTSYSNISNNITIDSGPNIPFIGCGNALVQNPHHPLTLNNVLHAPKLTKNLVSVRKFTINNEVSVEFDPFGFSMKDFQTGMPLMRCHSSGYLYPLTTRPYHPCSTPSTFATLSNEIWHNRLGHPGVSILSSLHRNNSILCNKFQNNFFCQSCQLRKQIKLPFYESL